MTQHEALSFISGMQLYMRSRGIKPPPTWEFARVQIGHNWELIADSPHLALNSFRRVVGALCRRGYAALGPCSEGCHAKHVWLTEKGWQALKLLDRDGCAGCLHLDRREQCCEYQISA